MKSWKFLLAALLVSCSNLFAENPTITVDVSKPGIKVSPLLYGVFFEEINRSGDGGIYAEMLENRSFEDRGNMAGWEVQKGSGVEATTAIDNAKPIHEQNPRCLRVEVTKAGETGITLSNDGFKGMSVKSGAKYIASLYARCDDAFKGSLDVRIETSGGQKKVAGKVENIGTEWKRFEIPLTVADSDTKAKLVIEDNSPGVVWLDMICLFPADCWKGRPSGLRTDLVQMIADMKPAFVRFPGGCWVEGETMATAYRWKETIGDIAHRKSNYNLWRYMSTNGLGYHEYLQLCEDMKAEPLWVVNCGMSHVEQRATDRNQPVPMDNVAQWLQDALDSIEYANGDVSTKYGAMRAAAGHPAPFGLKYIEIGNENGGPAYNERYAVFYDAIKKKYPEMNLIADLWRGNLPRNRPNEIIDEHYYNNPGFFLNNADRYDTYDRSGPKIYVGEYAVTREAGQGNHRAAVAEAAFMAGMERNSDIVIMASYAPLFTHTGYKVWNPDAINFDASRCYGTPSYWVQQMFGTNRADVVLPMQISASQEIPKPRGGIGLGTWNTKSEFKDIKVEKDGKTVWEADLAKGIGDWKQSGGEWSVADGAILQSRIAERCLITIGDPSWENYTLTLKARKLDGREGFLILFNVANESNFGWWNIGGWNNARHGFEVFSDSGAGGPIGRDANGGIAANRWYDIKIEVAGTKVKGYLDGRLIREADYTATQPLYGVAGKAGDDVILKIVNASTTPRETALKLDGASQIEPKASAIVLAGNALDENTLDQPTKVAPQKSEVSVSGSFTHTFPPNSVTILRLKAK